MRHHLTHLRLTTFTAALLLPALLASQAEATLIYSAQVGATKPIMDDGKGREGYGIDVVGRLGVGVPFPFFDMELEAIMGVSTYGFGGDATTQTMRAGLGGRGGVNFAAYPQGFLHVSYGRQFNAAVGSPSGMLLDVGLAFDITAVPYVRLGIYGAYNHLIHTEASKVGDGDGQWFSFGVQGSFVD